MKRLIIFITLLFVSTPSFATDPGVYIGAGGSYVYEDFDINSDVSKTLNYIGIDDEFSNTNGINLKVGYRVNDISSWELGFDYLPGFEWNGDMDYSGAGIRYANASLDAEINVMTLMLISKIAPNFGSDIIKPFITAGVGVMYSELEVKADASAKTTGRYGNTYKGSFSASDSEISPCFKLGTGIDFFIKEHLSVGFEVAYILGTGTLSILEQDIVENCKYINCTFGIAYYF